MEKVQYDDTSTYTLTCRDYLKNRAMNFQRGISLPEILVVVAVLALLVWLLIQVGQGQVAEKKEAYRLGVEAAQGNLEARSTLKKTFRDSALAESAFQRGLADESAKRNAKEH